MIKFSAYRLASKLRSIQKKLQLDLLDIEVAHRVRKSTQLIKE